MAQIWVFYILAPSPSSVCEFGEEGERETIKEPVVSGRRGRERREEK